MDRVLNDAPLVVPPSQEAGRIKKVEQGQERADHGGHVGERGGAAPTSVANCAWLTPRA